MVDIAVVLVEGQHLVLSMDVVKSYLGELEYRIFEDLAEEVRAERYAEAGILHHMAEEVYHIGRIVEVVETLRIPVSSRNLFWL